MAVSGPQSIVQLYNPANTSESVIFPITPAEVQAQAAAVIYSFSESRRGGISRPRGRKESQYSFTCRLPGVAMATMPHVHDWQPPANILAQLDAWAQNNDVAQRTKLRLLIPVKGINQDVYLGNYTYRWTGAFGDAQLQVQLTEFRPLTVDLTVMPQTTAPDQQPDSGSDTPPETPPTPSTYTVQPGDSLWLIAKQLLGDGGQWQQLYNANADVIGANPNLIQPGTALSIPGGQDTGTTT